MRPESARAGGAPESSESSRNAAVQTRGSGLSNREVIELYERYGHLVARRCSAILRGSSLAQDAMQTVFLKVMRHGGSLRDATSPLSWLYTVVDRCCLDIAKKQRRHTLWYAEPPPETGASAPPLEERGILSALLDRLSTEERVIALLLFGDGLTQGEVSAQLGWSRQTINKKAKRIRELAREMNLEMESR